MKERVEETQQLGKKIYKTTVEDYRIFTGKVRLVKVIDVRHMTPPNFAFKSNRSIRSNQQGNSSCSTGWPGWSFCIDLIEDTSNETIE